VNVVVLLALSDDGHLSFGTKHAEQIPSLGCPVFACTPDQFPELMAIALAGRVSDWAASQDTALVRSA